MQKKNARSGYWLPIFLLSLLAVVVALTAPRFLRHAAEPDPAATESQSQAATADSSEQPAGQPQKSREPARAENSSPPVSAPESKPELAATPGNALSAPGASPPSEPQSEKRETIEQPEPEGGSAARGQVLTRVLPQASSKALASIHGTVRVGVRVQVDATGAVSSADLAPPGPSKYFADLALQAAGRWEFRPPVSDGHNRPSEWNIRFEFTQNGATADPVQRLQ